MPAAGPRHLLEGVRRFRSVHYPANEARYRRLAAGQAPGALFITCSDSRIVPTTLVDVGPGELFVVRNIANVVPPATADHRHAETLAAVEYAAAVLEVSDIVVCGHSGCGGVQALYEAPTEALPHLGPWLDLIRDVRLPIEADAGRTPDEVLRETERRNVARSLERLRSHPMVAERLQAGQVALHGWYYDIGSGAVTVLDAATGAFVDTTSPGRLPGRAPETGGEGNGRASH